MQDRLELKGVTVHYGTAEAVRGVNIQVTVGSVVSIIGANGAGKSTIMKAISGLAPISGGEIWFGGERIDGKAAHEIVGLGIVQVPEGRSLFPYLSVLVNLKLGAFLRKDNRGVNADLDMVFERFPVLARRRNQHAGTLSGGEQQLLAIGRALMAKPKLLLLDEPSLGLSPLLVEEIARVITDIHKSAIGVLLVEQNAGLVTRVTDKGYVLEVGRVVLEGNLKELMDNQLVQEAFLGA
jgi:branched-chain amino acid transport system ATP-binding protein